MSELHQHGSSRANMASTNGGGGKGSHHARPVPGRHAAGPEFDLIRDDDTWAFRDADDSLVNRRLRMWSDGNGGLIAVVTEAGTGTCITEAAAEVHRKLTVEYPDQRVRLFEHLPADTDDGSDEQFDEVMVDGAGEVTWMSIPAGPFAFILRLPPPQQSQNRYGRVAVHRVFRCFLEGSVTITDPHGVPLGMLVIPTSERTVQPDWSHRLAAALLATATTVHVANPDLVSLFARTVLSELPASGWRLGDAQITGWLHSQSSRPLVS